MNGAKRMAGKSDKNGKGGKKPKPKSDVDKYLKDAAGLDTGHSMGYAVVPVIVGDSAQTAVLADRVFKRGLNALPIIYPAVPEKGARLRFFITSEHTDEQIDTAVRITAEELSEVRRHGSVLKQLVGR